MNRPAIVIRDIHHYGDDLTVPEAVARLRDGGQVTVTVTDPAPAEGDPRGKPRHGFDITVRPALGGQPELPPEISWEARSFETPDSAALFAEALALASQLAACAGPASGQSALARAAAQAAPGGRTPRGAHSPAPRPATAATSPPGSTPATRSPATCPARPPCPAPSTSVRHPRPGPLLRHLPGRRPRAGRGRGRLLQRRRRSPLRRGRAHRPRPRRAAPRHEQPSRRGMNPRRANAQTPRPSSGKLDRRSRLP